VLDGEPLFEQKCAVCHGIFGEGEGRWPVLAGGYDTLTEERPDKTVGSYWPYASTLWDYIHRAMPFFNPQSLSDDEVYTLTAYVLYLNDIVDDSFVLNRNNLATIEMPNRDGFIPDDRPDVQNVACVENCIDPQSIAIAWDSTELGVTPVEHFRPSEEGAAETPTTLARINTDAGKTVYERSCAACHGTGVAGAPKTGDIDAWLERIPRGQAVLLEHAIRGYRGKAGYMPPKGGNSQLSDEEVGAAVGFMIENSQATDTQL
jgi:cytochrome c